MDYATYHLLGEPETTIDNTFSFPFGGPDPWLESGRHRHFEAELFRGKLTCWDRFREGTGMSCWYLGSMDYNLLVNGLFHLYKGRLDSPVSRL